MAALHGCMHVVTQARSNHKVAGLGWTCRAVLAGWADWLGWAGCKPHQSGLTWLGWARWAGLGWAGLGWAGRAGTVICYTFNEMPHFLIKVKFFNDFSQFFSAWKFFYD